MVSVSSRRIGVAAIAAPTSWGRRCAAIGKQPAVSAAAAMTSAAARPGGLCVGGAIGRDVTRVVGFANVTMDM